MWPHVLSPEMSSVILGEKEHKDAEDFENRKFSLGRFKKHRGSNKL